MPSSLATRISPGMFSERTVTIVPPSRSSRETVMTISSVQSPGSP